MVCRQRFLNPYYKSLPLMIRSTPTCHAPYAGWLFWALVLWLLQPATLAALIRCWSSAFCLPGSNRFEKPWIKPLKRYCNQIQKKCCYMCICSPQWMTEGVWGQHCLLRNSPPIQPRPSLVSQAQARVCWQLIMMNGCSSTTAIGWPTVELLLIL